MPASCANAFSPTIALFGCGPKVMMRRQQLAGREQMLGDDAGFKRQPIAARIHRHDDLFQRGIAGTLADAVDGALDLPRAGLHRRQRIRDRQAQIVMAVYADNRGIAQRLHHPCRSGRHIHRAPRNPTVSGRLTVRAPAATTAAKLVPDNPGSVRVASSAENSTSSQYYARQRHRRHGFVQNLLPRFLQLVLQMDVAGGDEGVDARALARS